MQNNPLNIVYCTPALYMAGGVERVLTLKANYLAEHYGHHITIILTEGKGKPLFYKLSDKVEVRNLGIDFEELWSCGFVKKVLVYLKKQRLYRRRLTKELLSIRPDITVSMMRREINFINDIADGSKKIGELHINRSHYRNFEANDSNPIKALFAKLWMGKLVREVKRLDRLVVLTDKDRMAWSELSNVEVIPNPLPFRPKDVSRLTSKRVIAVGRYCHEKGFDMLIDAWSKIAAKHPDWKLEIFGDGERTPFQQMISQSGTAPDSCLLHGRTDNIEKEYIESSLLVCSSRFEGFGMMIAEAMACGLPVVSFDCPWGPGFIIKDGEDGILVENGNTEELSKQMSRLISDETLRKQMGQKAHRNIARFDIENIAKQWNDLFENL